MDDLLKQALEIVKAQAGVRAMTEEQILAMTQTIAAGLKNAVEITPTTEETAAPVTTKGIPTDWHKSIKERSVICMECGKVFKIISSKHLATHGLSPDEYRAKYGFKKGTPLTCKELQRVRRKKMQDMRLWEKRKKA